MRALQILKQYKIEAMFVATIICALVLTLLANSNSIAFKQGALLITLTLLSVCQILIVRGYLQLKRREHQFHQVSRKLVQTRSRRSRDEALALKILNHINSASAKTPDHAKVWQKPLHEFSGDLALAYESESGSKYTLLADLTGHGIAAAISAAPVASIFRATARNGLPVEEIVTELNNRLQELLPSGFFCCAAIVCDHQGAVTVCNAGLPDILIADNDGQIVNTITSKQLPLGIEHLYAEDVELFTVDFGEPHQLYAFTDGLIETSGANDEVFDVEASVSVSQGEGSGRISSITERFEAFTKDSNINDDISIVEVMIR